MGSPPMPTILTVAGSDSSGGAGIQADLLAIAANGGLGAAVVTAVTAQNTLGVAAIDPVRPAMVRAQLEAVFDDLEVAALKTGMLVSEDTVGVVSELIRERRPPAVVCDPVIASTSGHRLLTEGGVRAFVRELLPLATLVTPNVDEAEILTGLRPRDRREAEEAARRIVALGARAVLLKGGHLEDDRGTDVLVSGATAQTFVAPWIDVGRIHGAGCAYSAAIATHLGRGIALGEAIECSKEFVSRAIRGARAVGRGAIPPDAMFFVRDPSPDDWLRRVRELAPVRS